MVEELKGPPTISSFALSDNVRQQNEVVAHFKLRSCDLSRAQTFALDTHSPFRVHIRDDNFEALPHFRCNVPAEIYTARLCGVIGEEKQRQGAYQGQSGKLPYILLVITHKGVYICLIFRMNRIRFDIKR